jgi:hypothetical protein
MRANKHHKKKPIISGFKLSHSRGEPPHKKEKWVDENNTKEVEILTGGLLVNYLRQVEKREVLYFSPNNNDEHKNPDIFIHIDGKIQSVQIAQIVLNEYLTKFNQTKKLCEKISQFVVDIYKPPIKVNIQIYPPWENEEPSRTTGKVHKQAANIIADSIFQNIEKLMSEYKFINFEFDKKIFMNFADSFNLLPVPDGHQSNYFGDNNVYIDYEFDEIKISKDDIANSVNKVFNDKEGGNSDILLIWGDLNHFMGTMPLIFEKLQEKFKVTSFKYVYFLCFHNTAEIENRKMYCSKVNE